MSTKTVNSDERIRERAPKIVCQHCRQIIAPEESPYIVILPTGSEQRWHVACDAAQTLRNSQKKKRR